MTLLVPVFDNIGLGTRIDLAQEQNLFVGPGIEISSTDLTTAIRSSAASDNEIIIMGTVSSGATGILLENAVTRDVLRIETGGVVSAAFYAVMSATSSLIENNGTVLSGQRGIGISGLTGHNHTVINNGLIVAPGGIYFQSTFSSAVGMATVLNTGTIRSDGYAIDLQISSADYHSHVTNRGLLIGNVTLGYGADVLDNLGGTIRGLIDLSSGNDTMIGSATAETIVGGSGTDLLDLTTLGAVRLYLDGSGTNAGAATGDSVSGFEHVSGSNTGSDFLSGTYGANRLEGNGGNDSLFGSLGIDTLYGGAGNDSLDGDVGNDIMEGGAGDDIYVFDSDFDVAVEGVNAGHDLVRVRFSTTLGANVEDGMVDTIGARSISGNALNNRLTGNIGNDTLVGGLGNDVLLGGLGADSLDGGGGNDSLDGGAANDIMSGGAGNDIYVFDMATDQAIEALNAGRDLIKTPVSLTLAANVEDGLILGSIGRALTGNALANVLTGGSGADQLFGGIGNDLLDGGLGNDVMNGGANDDIYVVTSSTDQVVEAVGAGRDTVRTSVSLTLAANVEVGVITSAVGRSLVGNAAINSLSGFSGADILVGGGGKDVLTGGAGADQFRFFATAEAGDLINDFTSGVDDIVLKASAFGGLPVGGLASGRFIIRADNLAQQADDRFVFRTTDKTLWYDANGNAAGGLVMLADLQAGATMSFQDVILI